MLTSNCTTMIVDCSEASCLTYLGLVLHPQQQRLALKDEHRHIGQADSSLEGAVHLLEQTDDPWIEVN